MEFTYIDAALIILVGLSTWSGFRFYKYCIRPHLKGRRGERRLRKLLEDFEYEAAHNVYVPNADGELAQIDHLIKFRGTIGVVETKAFSGEIRGVEYDRYWLQTIKGYDRKFPNPLGQVKRQVKHLQNMLPSINTRGTVVYAGEATFPHGTPNDVYTFEEFRRELGEYKTRKNLHDHPPELEAAWVEILDQARQTTREQKRKHLRQLRKKYGRDARQDATTMLFALFVLSTLSLGVYRLAL